MKKFTQLGLILCVVLLFSACATTKAEYVGAAHEIDIVFDPDSAGYGPYISVEINGTEYQAFFDTGDYSGLILPSQEIEKFDLEVTSTQKSMRIDTEVIESNVYTIPQMLIGDNLIVYDVECHEEISPDVQIPVIIGMQSFKDKYNVLISYKQEKIYLWEKNYTPPFLFEWTNIPITDPENLFVSGIIDGETYTFGLDTGAYGMDSDGLHDFSFENMEGFEKTGKLTIPFELAGRKFSSTFMYLETPYRDMLPFDFLFGTVYYKHDVFIDFDEAMVYIEN